MDEASAEVFVGKLRSLIDDVNLSAIATVAALFVKVRLEWRLITMNREDAVNVVISHKIKVLRDVIELIDEVSSDYKNDEFDDDTEPQELLGVSEIEALLNYKVSH